jgi:hypothetical protein
MNAIANEATKAPRMNATKAISGVDAMMGCIMRPKYRRGNYKALD